MAKLADAADLKSADLNRSWGFKSPSGHHGNPGKGINAGDRRSIFHTYGGGSSGGFNQRLLRLSAGNKQSPGASSGPQSRGDCRANKPRPRLPASQASFERTPHAANPSATVVAGASLFLPGTRPFRHLSSHLDSRFSRGVLRSRSRLPTSSRHLLPMRSLRRHRASLRLHRNDSRNPTSRKNPRQRNLKKNIWWPTQASLVWATFPGPNIT
jgi:hypothetical protein